MTRRERARLGCLGLALLLGALAWGHIAFWYGARERAAGAAADDEPARLLGDPSFDLALWLPYPHQNLAVLEEALGGRSEAEAWLAAVVRLAGGAPERGGGERTRIPAFGPFAVPPSREVTLAWRRGRPGDAGDEGQARLAARIYPALARIGRLAGTVAGNPWLAGGEVQALGGGARVGWDGSLWRIVRGPDGGLESGPEAEGEQGLEPALARLRLSERAATRDLPAGSYRLSRPRDDGAGGAAGDRGDLEVILEGNEPSSALDDPWTGWDERFRGSGVLAVWAQGPRRERTGIAVLFRDDDRDLLPPAAVLAPASPTSSGARRLRLVHEKLPSFLRDELESATVGPWRVLATGGSALQEGGSLARELPAPEQLPDLGLWVDLSALRSFVDTVVEVMEEVPLFPRRELRRWRDLRTVVAPLEGFDRLVLLSTGRMPTGGGVDLPRKWRLRLIAAPSD